MASKDGRPSGPSRRDGHRDGPLTPLAPRMRIAVWHNLPSGGGRRVLHDHVTGLAARGHAVEVWCPPTADRDYLPLPASVPEHVVPLDWPPAPGAVDRLLGTTPTPRELAAMRAHARACAAEMARGGFDVLYAHSCQFFATSPMARASDLPAVLYLQEPYRLLYEALPHLPWLTPPGGTPPLGPRARAAAPRAALADVRYVDNLRLRGHEERENAAAFARILVNSRFSRESVLRAYGLDARVCYVGVDAARFVDRGGPREGYVVGLGSFMPTKNVAFVIEALATVPEDRRPPLVWVSNAAHAWYVDEMTALARARGVALETRVRIADDELVDVLNRASAMVYAPRLEPFGLAPLEAGACGVPVVAVAEGGVRETVEHEVTGLVVEADPAAAGEAVARLLADPALARRLGRQARRAVETRWSLEASAERAEAHLAQVAFAPR